MYSIAVYVDLRPTATNMSSMRQEGIHAVEPMTACQLMCSCNKISSFGKKTQKGHILTGCKYAMAILITRPTTWVCPTCSDTVQDEMHAIFCCPDYAQHRDLLIYFGRS